MDDFLPGIRYRMPVGFGPAVGPRQRADGQPWDDPMARIEVTAVSFLTDPAHLRRLLPPGLDLDGEPVVSIELMRISELQWLAGRGYCTLGVRFPGRCAGKTRTFRGPFLAVLWENMADPIITGREELGFAKLYCDIPPPRSLEGRRCHVASWEGHRFMTMVVEGLVPSNAGSAVGDGTLHYRYVPAVGAGGAAQVKGVVVTPPAPRTELIDHACGQGTVRFHKSTWEELPTLHHIVNALADLPVLESRGATVSNVRTDTSLHNHFVVE